MRKGVNILASMLVVVGVAGAALAGDEVRGARESKTFKIGFRAASMTPVADYQKTNLRDGTTIFVAPRAVITDHDVVSAISTGQDAIELNLTPEAAAAFGRSGADRVAIVLDGRVSSLASIGAGSAGRVELSGISATDVVRVARMLDAGVRVDGGPQVQVVARQTTAQPGDTVSFDIFVSNVKGLRTFQMALDVVGGRGGTFQRVAGKIDESRADFVWGRDQAINAVDDVDGRLGGVRFDGSLDVTGPAYLGTFNYVVPSDATGTYIAKVRMNESSFLADIDHQQFPFNATGAAVTVGSRDSR